MARAVYVIRGPPPLVLSILLEQLLGGPRVEDHSLCVRGRGLERRGDELAQLFGRGCVAPEAHEVGELNRLGIVRPRVGVEDAEQGIVVGLATRRNPEARQQAAQRRKLLLVHLTSSARVRRIADTIRFCISKVSIKTVRVGAF